MKIDSSRNGYRTDILTSVLIQIIVEVGAKIFEVYKSVICKKVFNAGSLRIFVFRTLDLSFDNVEEKRNLLQDRIKSIILVTYVQTIKNCR